MNIILRTISIKLVSWIGEDTHSQQLKSTTNAIFIAQFFNTGLLLLLVNANFNEVGIPGGSVFKGAYYDYIPAWYATVGYRLTQTMIINSIMPFSEIGVGWTMKTLFRKMDRSWSDDDQKTKISNLNRYIELYSGPEYMIHFKYAGMLNVLYVTMMYGIGIPIMFPIAAFTYFILYSVERLTVCYFYQQPPAFDDKLTKNMIKLMRQVPVLYLTFGYWMLSNKQIFLGSYTFIKNTTEVMKTGHSFATISVDQATPMMLMGAAIGIIIFFQIFFKKTLKEWGFNFGGAKIEVDENLPIFYKAIKLSECDWMVKENENLREVYGFEMINKKIQEILDDTKAPKKTISGVPYYILLANPRYARDFSYISCNVPNRPDLIKDDDDNEDNDNEQSDIVAIVLNLAYIHPNVASKFKFVSGFSL